MKTLIKRVWFTIAFVLVGMALIFSLFRGLTPWISQYKGQLETELSVFLGEKVTIETMETGWFWFEPVIRLNQVELSHGLNQDLKINQLIVGIDLWSSLRQWKLQPGVLLADGVCLDFNQENGKWQIKGLERVGVGSSSLSLQSLPAIWRWILNQKRIDFKDTQMTLHLQGGTIIPLSLSSLSIENNQGFYKMKASAKTRQTVQSKLQLLATLQLDAGDLRRSQGSIYVDINHILLTQWQSLFPKTYHQFESGSGRFQGWIDLKEGSLQNFQGKLKLSNTAVKVPHSDQLYFIQKFVSQFAWHPNKNGWIINSNDTMLKIHGKKFVNQSISLAYDRARNYYQLISPEIDLRLLYFAPLSWSKSWLPYINQQLMGKLNHLNVGFDKQGLTRLFTQFNLAKLANTKSHWYIEDVSGVLNWQKDNGKLKIDSPKAAIHIDNYPAIQNIGLATEVNWHRDGKRWMVDNIYSNITHKHLQMSHAGRAMIGANPGDSTINLKSQFIINDGEFWQPFIPDHVMEDGLKDWLTKDIKHIGKVVGELTLKGRLADFPYEKGKGKFLIETSISDVALAPVPGWPAATKLGGSLIVQGRNLDAAIYQGRFGNNSVEKFKLGVDNLGLNKEVIRVHTQVSARGKSVMDYLFSTPLERHLQPLKQIQVQGPIALDLQIEVPLFDDSHPVYVLGDVTLKNNDINVTHDGITFPLRKGYGHILFNQHGLTTGDLHGLLWRQPMSIRLKSMQHIPDSYVKVLLDGIASVDEMSKIIPSPFWQFLSGKARVKADLKITDKDSDLDDFYIRSDLKGVSINLPEPLHKNADKALPTVTHIAFNPSLGFRKEVKMGNVVSANMWYSVKDNHVELDRGEIRLGGTKAVLPQSEGVQILGTLSDLSIAPWQSVFAKFPQDNQSYDFANKLKFVDIRIRRLFMLNQDFNDLSCQISQPHPGKWQIKMKQAKVDMDVTYHSQQNLLTGVINRLNWQRKTNPGNLSSELRPSDIPNLKLKFKSLKVNQIPLGELAIEGHSVPDHWKLELLTLQSPYYQLNMNGDWKYINQKNETKLAGRMQFQHLGKALTQWHIKPLVSANWGQVDFNAHSASTLLEMDLSSINANLDVLFRHGVVTELSKETEEKIGLGKLLSILSLQTIPRRLQLDFSDLSNKGYSFDKFKGKFTLKEGKLTTGNSDIDGPVAYAAIGGTLNLIKQTYDVKLRIVPHVTASLPVVATIAGGPIAGAVTWVVSKIITQEMQRVTGYTYKIDGPWNDPQVQQLHIDKQKIKQKAG